MKQKSLESPLTVVLLYPFMTNLTTTTGLLPSPGQSLLLHWDRPQRQASLWRARPTCWRSKPPPPPFSPYLLLDKWVNRIIRGYRVSTQGQCYNWEREKMRDHILTHNCHLETGSPYLTRPSKVKSNYACASDRTQLSLLSDMKQLVRLCKN